MRHLRYPLGQTLPAVRLTQQYHAAFGLDVAAEKASLDCAPFAEENDNCCGLQVNPALPRGLGICRVRSVSRTRPRALSLQKMPFSSVWMPPVSRLRCRRMISALYVS